MLEKEHLTPRSLHAIAAINPYRWLAISFIGVIIVGTILLMLPISSADHRMTSIIDALFTATSCVSVTGLTVVDTYTHWSLVGQLIMIVLIQIGGMGTMVLSTVILLVLRKRIGLENRLLIQADTGDTRNSIVLLVKRIVTLTVVVEMIGAIGYIWQLYPYLGSSSFYYGTLQSISTFCNAGFVFFDNALPYNMISDWAFTLITCTLISIGGFGYMALYDIGHNGYKGIRHLELHTRIMLYGQVVLVVLGTVFIAMLEWSNGETLGQLAYLDRWQAALFQAITPRTAGLATIDYSAVHPITAFVTIILMFIGAGPNSTGGGVKISTIAIIWAVSTHIFNRRTDVVLGKSSIANDTIYRACGIVFFSTLCILLGTCVLAWQEPYPFLSLLFEVQSAFSTVGLSMGITPYLDTCSKWVLIIIMFTGRIGVLTLIGTFALRRKAQDPIAYPEGHIVL